MAPIDQSRAHAVGFHLSWHARAMVAAWGILSPFAVLTARYFKILPWQDWPRKLDNPTWWWIHRIGQYAVLALTGLGLAFILSARHVDVSDPMHRFLGYAVIGLGVLQALSGILRGSKGGPTSPGPDGSAAGDHFDMTRRRLLFETVHKSLGYVALLAAVTCILSGLWVVNAPNWMWLIVVGWWTALAALALWLQIRFGAYDTYQAIWGPDQSHPGNRMGKQGWGTVRPGDIMQIWGRRR